MTANANRMSTHTAGSGETEGRNGEQKKNLWTSMLESVASGKRLPEKNLLVLGTIDLLNQDGPHLQVLTGS
jgi:dynein light intermediate chain 1